MNTIRKYSLPLAFVFLIGAAIFTYLVFTDSLTGLDDLRFPVYEMRDAFFNGLMKFITFFGNWYTVVIICLIVLLIPSTRIWLGVPLSIVSLSSTGLHSLLKHIFDRARPEDVLHLATEFSSSYPSGHSMTVLVAYFSMAFLINVNLMEKENRTSKLTVVLFVLLVMLIGFSRIYLGVHYPSDVLGGWLMGLAVFFAFCFIYLKIKGRRGL